jgi:integrase
MSTVVAFKHPKLNAPSIENGKVAPPRRVTNLERRSREHLTPAEVERMIVAAGKEGRHGLRDRTLVLIAYRHGLRVSELVALRWEQVDLPRGALHVNRRKNGEAATHPLSGHELRALRQLKRAFPESPFLFVTERGGPITDATVRKIVDRAGRNAGIDFQSTRTCCATRRASIWQTTASTPAQSKRISATATSCTPCGTRSSHRIDFAPFGAIDSPYEWPGSAKTG